MNETMREIRNRTPSSDAFLCPILFCLLLLDSCFFDSFFRVFRGSSSSEPDFASARICDLKLLVFIRADPRYPRFSFVVLCDSQIPEHYDDV